MFRKIQDFWINTVVKGLKSSPYQANETRLLLAKQEKHNYPLGADILEHRTYMDDSFGGGDDLESAEKAKQQLIDILLKADMHLDKWSANHVSLLPITDSNNKELTFVIPDVVSTLGLKWKPETDEFVFSVDLRLGEKAVTKRNILSEVARLFDPMGWLAPSSFVQRCCFKHFGLRAKTGTINSQVQY